MLASSCVVNSGASQTCVRLLAAVCSSQYDAAVLLSPQAPKAVRCFPWGLNSRYSAASGQIFFIVCSHSSHFKSSKVCCYVSYHVFTSELP